VNFSFTTSFRRTIASQCAAAPDDPAASGLKKCGHGAIPALAGPHSSRAALPGPCDHQDQTVTGLNKCGAHQPLQALASERDALSAPLELGNVDTQYRRLLTPPETRWKFCLSRTPAETPAIAAGAGFIGSEAWGDIEVPMSIECANHGGQPFYTNFVYPFKCDPPKIADAINYVGCYQTQIQIPSDWRGRRVFLYFEGAGSALQCWLDGRLHLFVCVCVFVCVFVCVCR